MEGIVMEESRYSRFKSWALRHEEGLIMGAGVTVIVVLFVVAIKANISYQARIDAELDGYIDALNELYANLADGSL